MITPVNAHSSIPSPRPPYQKYHHSCNYHDLHHGHHFNACHRHQQSFGANASDTQQLHHHNGYKHHHDARHHCNCHHHHLVFGADASDAQQLQWTQAYRYLLELPGLTALHPLNDPSILCLPGGGKQDDLVVAAAVVAVPGLPGVSLPEVTSSTHCTANNDFPLMACKASREAETLPFLPKSVCL